MIGCLIGLIIVVIICVIVLYILETALGTLLGLPPQIYTLLRLLAALLVLLWFIGCIGLLPGLSLHSAFRY